MSLEYVQRLSEARNFSTSKKDIAPLPLCRPMSVAPVFPTEMLGPIMSEACKCLNEVIQASMGICGQSLLAASAVATQALRDITIDGRDIPLCENFISVAASGERKSAVDKEVLKEHRQYEKDLNDEYKNLISQFHLDDEYYRKQKKKWKPGDKRPMPPQKPAYPFILTGEPTLEGLTKLIADGQSTIGLFADEGGRMLGGHSMNKDNQQKTICGLSELWDGKEIKRVRASEEPIMRHGRRVSFHLMMQPIIAHTLFSNKLISDQGFLPRCLLSWPQSTLGSRNYKEHDLSCDPRMIKYHDRIKMLFGNLAMLKNIPDYKIKKLFLSPDAKKYWIELHDSIEKELGSGKDFEYISAFGSKAAEHLLRLAGIMATFENPECEIIEKEFITRGFFLIQYYIAEAMRLNSVSSVHPDLLIAEKLLDFVKRYDYIYVQLVSQKGPNSIRTAKTAKKYLGILEEHHYLEREEPMVLDGHKRKEVWRVRKEHLKET